MAADTMAALVEDLRRQEDALDELLAGLGPDEWAADSAADGWTIKDQAFHISYFDRVAAEVVTDPAGFRAALPAILADPDRYMREHLDPGRSQSGDQVLAEWRQNRAAMLEIFASTDAKARHPWFGPDMSTASFATARLMEIFAHGQDIADGAGRPLDNDHGLAHIAHLGVITRGYSYAARGRHAPDAPVFVELTMPGGAVRRWGEPEVTDRITGPARDFCLVVTQRRHLLDVELHVDGPAATEWMSIAQAFAGKPGEGRRPGQFPRAGATR